MKLLKLALFGLLLGIVLPASAEILLLANGEESFVRLQNSPSIMSGIVIVSTVPSASMSPRLANNLQRAHAWSAYESQPVESGSPLIFGGGSAAKDRQSAARANVTRAQAFRLDLFK